jgi:hypothetical protein
MVFDHGFRKGEYIIEMISRGNVLKVTAVCPHTGREVSMVGDPTVPEERLRQLAIRKLEYVLNKEKK